MLQFKAGARPRGGSQKYANAFLMSRSYRLKASRVLQLTEYLRSGYAISFHFLLNILAFQGDVRDFDVVLLLGAISVFPGE